MTGGVVPFPMARRKPLVTRCAARMLEMNAAAAERHLEALLRTQAETMRRKSISESAISRELKSLEAAVRSALWHRVLAPGGVA
jgi:hypothetical protein